jgi:hypothetical protein
MEKLPKNEKPLTRGVLGEGGRFYAPIWIAFFRDSGKDQIAPAENRSPIARGAMYLENVLFMSSFVTCSLRASLRSSGKLAIPRKNIPATIKMNATTF